MRLPHARKTERSRDCSWLWIGWLALQLVQERPFILARSAAASLRRESFDRDPGWEGKNNRPREGSARMIQRDFGYQTTNLQGRLVGQIGGTVWQSARPAYYGKALPALSLDQPLSASGKLRVLEARSISGWHTTANVYVGWFNADPGDWSWRPRNFLGFRLQSFNEPDGALVELTYGTRAWQAGGMFVNARGGGQRRNVRELAGEELLRIAPDGAAHTWSFAYDPDAAGGAGEITFVFDGTQTQMPIAPSSRENGAEFNRFGIFAPRIPGLKMAALFEELVINGRGEDLSRDPGWRSFGNRERCLDPVQYGQNDFGFSQTSHAGGQPGEMGGRIFSCDPGEDEFKAYYGGSTGELSLNDRLFARGKFVAREFSIDSSFALGWFNSRKQGWPLENFVGVYFDSLSSEGRIAAPIYGTRNGNQNPGRRYLRFVPGEVYEWSLAFEPSADKGRGAIRLTLGGQSVDLTLQPADREVGARFDRFGLVNMQWANSKWCDVYFDDLEYTIRSD